jgi:metal transporter CNNM
MAPAISAARSRPAAANGVAPSLGRVHMLLVCLFHAFAPVVKAIPLPFGGAALALAEEAHPKQDASLVLYLGIALVLVLGGGVFAGLTIAQVSTGAIHVPAC